MRTALIVLCGFAAVWGAFGLSLSGLDRAVSLMPIVVSLAIVWAGWSVPSPRPGEGRRTGRIVGLASLGEGIAILVGVNLALHLGRSDLIVPIVAFLVGAHFVPLARFLPAPSYYATAIAMMALAVSALVLPMPLRAAVIGIGCAAILWTTALHIVARLGRKPPTGR